MLALILDNITFLAIGILCIFSFRRLIFCLTAILTRPNDSLLHATKLPFVSIFIPCHNEDKVIKKTLDALLGIDYPIEKLEIVVIDDLSNDNTLSIIREYEKKYAHIHSLHRSTEKARGKAASLNEAIKKYSKGDILYFLDADHYVMSDSLKKLVRHFSDPHIGAVNGHSVPHNRYAALISSYVYLESLVHNRITMYASDKLQLCPGIQGSNFCIRRSLMERIGYFDEADLTEDLDLTIRIYEQAYSVKYDVTSITENEAPNSIKSYMLQHLRWNRGFNKSAKKNWREILSRKHQSIPSRIEQILFSLGYFDRLFFIVAIALTIISLMGSSEYLFPYWVWVFFAGMPALEILASLMLSREPMAMYLRLPLILSMFSIDLLVAFIAFFQDITKREANWYKTPRAGTQP